MTEPLLKARDVALMLGLEYRTVVERFQAGDLPGFRLYGRRGGPLRFRRSEIEAWLEQQCRATTVGDTLTERAGDAQPGAPARGPGGISSRATGIVRPLRG